MVCITSKNEYYEQEKSEMDGGERKVHPSDIHHRVCPHKRSAAESEGITMEEFEKWRIYKDDIVSYLEDENEGRKIEDLTKEECDEIIDELSDDLDYYYTEWY